MILLIRTILYEPHTMEQSDNHPHPTFHELGFVFESHRQSEIVVKLFFSLLENFVIFHIGLFAISDYCIRMGPLIR